MPISPPYSPQDPLHQVPQTDSPQAQSEEQNFSSEEDEIGKAEKSACAIVLVILLVLGLAGGGVWYYLKKYKPSEKKPQAIPPARIEELQKDRNLIMAASGGRVKACDEAEVIIPPGALEKDTKIEMECVERGDVTDLYHLQPNGLKFLKPVTVVIPYKRSGLLTDQTPYDIELKYWFKKSGPKKSLEYSVDTMEKKLRTQVKEF